MIRPAAVSTALLLTALPVALSLGCQRKSAAAVQAEEAAKAADTRVAQLEQELADLKAGKQAKSGDPDVVEHATKSQARAVEKRLADARKAAVQAHQEAKEVAAIPAEQAAKVVILTVPAQTRLAVTLARDLSTDQVQAGDPWEGALAEDVVVDGRVAWPQGTPVKGVVVQSTPAGRLQSGQGGLGIRLSTVGRSDVEAGTYVVTGDKRGERNAKFIGGTAALGALVGILSSKGHQGDHALGGAAIGAAAGTGLAAATADPVIRIPAGKVAFTLTGPEKVVLK